MKKWLITMLALLLLAGCAQNEHTENETTNTESTPSMEEQREEETEDKEEKRRGPFQLFTSEDVDGNEVTQAIFADYDLTVINIWGTFCGPCIEEMPALAELAEEYAAKNVQFIGLVGDAVDYSSGEVLPDIVADAKSIAEQTGATYLHVVPTNGLFYNVMGQISAFPTTVFVDSEGKQVDYAYMGAADKDTWAERIETALSQLEE